MSDHTIAPEITFAPKHDEGTKHIWKTFWILSAITFAELVIGLLIYNINKGDTPREFLILVFKGVVCILTLAKAYYIVSIFMHLGSEIRNFTMTIVVPLILFVWFIIAFLMDGNSWKQMRNTDAHSKTNKYQKEVPAKKQGAKD